MITAIIIIANIGSASEMLNNVVANIFIYLFFESVPNPFAHKNIVMQGQ